MTRKYVLAQYSWEDPEVITISSYDDQLIGTFPLTFIKRGGLNTWAFVSDIVHQLVDVAGGGVITTGNGEVVLQEAPYAGKFVFVPRSEQYHATDKPLRELTAADERASITFARGPESSRKGVAANTTSQSTFSNSKRSSIRQNEFRTSLIARDSTCLVTDARYTKCTPSHIIPQSRPDVSLDPVTDSSPIG
ncbi:hypothetical protein I308_103524 [Cryptococcus tetragattii IND107]|uniref:HNH nuclease domain-containing protein n=1 Tax=Cryptococcus tetragattii IND107 TaxID=1296105 RepID=A0ABR3BRD0_9TREE